MTHPDYLPTWERAAEPLPGRPGVPTHDRGGVLAPPTPAARMSELTNHVGELRGYLGEACAEVRRLRARDDRWHRMRDTSYGGIPCAQIWADFVLWETILNENIGLAGIVEVGTWEGGFSRWLHAQAQTRGMTFFTCDAIPPPFPPPGFRRMDVFAEPEVIQRIALESYPVVLFCDGGNKPRELATLGPFVGAKGLIVVHDWGTEMLPADVPETVEEVYGDFCDELGSISRVFRVKR